MNKIEILHQLAESVGNLAMAVKTANEDYQAVMESDCTEVLRCLRILIDSSPTVESKDCAESTLALISSMKMLHVSSNTVVPLAAVRIAISALELARENSGADDVVGQIIDTLKTAVSAGAAEITGQ
jgi:hypothetical protein